MQRNEKESIIAYMDRATQALSKGDISVKEWAEVVGGDGEVYSSETLRRCSNFFKMFLEQYNLLAKDGAPSEEREDLEQILEEIRKEKIKVQTANREYNANLRHDARQDMLDEKIVDAINRLEPLPAVPKVKLEDPKRVEGLLVLSDIHAGADFVVMDVFGSALNEYSIDILKERFGYILEWMKRKYSLETKKLTVAVLGDLVENVLRTSSLTKLKEPVVDTVIDFAEFFANWLNELQLALGIEVAVEIISGNHDEIRMLQQQPINAEENFAKLITEFVRLRLINNQNITVGKCLPAKLINVGDSQILLEHGSKNPSATYRFFKDVHGVWIDAMYCGHLHFVDMKSLGQFLDQDVKVHRVGSIMGIDPYSDSLRKGSLPSCHIAYYVDGEGESWSREIYLNKIKITN